MKNYSNIEFMNAVGKDIIGIKVTPDKTVAQLYAKFFKIMRKYKIKQGTKTKGGAIQLVNFEWTLCRSLFMQQLCKNIDVQYMFGGIKIPRDLKAY